MKICIAAITIAGFFISMASYSQNLSFSRPINFLPEARTDKAIDITNFNGSFFVTWKEAGAAGNVHVSYLGKQYDTSFSEKEETIPGAQSAFAPVLRVMNNRIYLLWIASDGTAKYIMNNSATSFDLQNINTLSFKNPQKLSSGITSAAVNGKLVIASHVDNKQDMAFAVFDAGKDGLFQPSQLQTIPGKGSTDYPFIVSISDSAARFCWKDYKGENIYYADYNLYTANWSNQQPVSHSKSKLSPAIYHVFNSSRLFYMWRGSKKDNRIYYTSDERENVPSSENVLPDYFTTENPVSICYVDDKKFIMAYIGNDQKLYLSYFTNYNSSRWMEDLLFPAKGSYVLSNIVIPGSHDAGMSVLSGTGGIQSSSINNCNTLTQTQNVAGQLNAGIRMFDLRVGRFHDELYIKHCSSDCMADAIGGGYGEKLKDILNGIKSFLKTNKKEIVLLTFSHFCEKEASAKDVAANIYNTIGKDLVYSSGSKKIDQVSLNELAGKVIVTFEKYASTDYAIDSCTIAAESKAFINFRREYAATNEIKNLLAKEEAFFGDIKNNIQPNDLIRLDWQLTQIAEEAAMVCNDFQSDKGNPLVNGAMLLTNVLKKNKSIVDRANMGNKYLPSKLNEWVSSGAITKKNKPNILYVDVAGGWITDYCIELNKTPLYNK